MLQKGQKVIVSTEVPDGDDVKKEWVAGEIANFITASPTARLHGFFSGVIVYAPSCAYSDKYITVTEENGILPH